MAGTPSSYLSCVQFSLFRQATDRMCYGQTFIWTCQFSLLVHVLLVEKEGRGCIKCLKFLISSNWILVVDNKTWKYSTQTLMHKRKKNCITTSMNWISLCKFGFNGQSSTHACGMLGPSRDKCTCAKGVNSCSTAGRLCKTPIS